MFTKKVIVMPADNATVMDQVWIKIIPHETLRRDLIASGALLTHYTKFPREIIASQELWLTNARDAEDKDEIRLGWECVDTFLSTNAEALCNALNAIRPGIYDSLMQVWVDECQAQIEQSYIACFTSQQVDDQVGSAFHWENYGHTALCFNPAFLKDEPSHLSLYLQKVIYGRDAAMLDLQKLLKTLQVDQQLLAAFAENDSNHVLLSFLRHRLFFTSISVKGEEFAQEEEWRLVYSPYLFSSAPIETKKISVQKDVAALPLAKRDATTDFGLEMESLFAQVMIHASWVPIHTQGKVVAQDLRNDLVGQLRYNQVSAPANRVLIIAKD